MSNIVFLDRQHLGNPKNFDSQGAAYNGAIEAHLTSLYLHFAEWKLREMGITVVLISDGTYEERHKRVNEYSRGYDKAVYISAHINAGKGDYCASFYDYRSSKGLTLASSINHFMARWMENIFCSPSKTKAIPANPNDWTKNAYYCIKGVNAPVAICFEPFFIDSPAHVDLLNEDGLEMVGIALAHGIKKYLDMTQ
jgi:N-acetylmuramoyl-L-alanine amidase